MTVPTKLSFPVVRPQVWRAAFREQKAAVRSALKQIGADLYDRWLPESGYLTRLLKPGERPAGVLFGKYTTSEVRQPTRGMLAITDRRILLVNKKPLFLQLDEIGFDVVSGVSYSKAGFGETVSLLTRTGNITFHLRNDRSVQPFVMAVDNLLARRNLQLMQYAPDFNSLPDAASSYAGGVE